MTLNFNAFLSMTMTPPDDYTATTENQLSTLYFPTNAKASKMFLETVEGRIYSSTTKPKQRVNKASVIRRNACNCNCR